MEYYARNLVERKIHRLHAYQKSILEAELKGNYYQALSKGMGIEDDISQENYIQMVVDSIDYIMHPGKTREHYYVLNYSAPNQWYSLLDNHSSMGDYSLTEAKSNTNILAQEEQAYFTHHFEFTYYLTVGERRRQRMEEHMLLSEYEISGNTASAGSIVGLTGMRIGINSTKKDTFIDSEFSRGKCIYINESFYPNSVRYIRPMYRAIVWSEAFARYDKQFGDL